MAERLTLGKLKEDERGGVATEHALLLAFIAVVIIGALQAFGLSVLALFQHAVDTLPF